MFLMHGFITFSDATFCNRNWQKLSNLSIKLSWDLFFVCVCAKLGRVVDLNNYGHVEQLTSSFRQ